MQGSERVTSHTCMAHGLPARAARGSQGAIASWPGIYSPSRFHTCRNGVGRLPRPSQNGDTVCGQICMSVRRRGWLCFGCLVQRQRSLILHSVSPLSHRFHRVMIRRCIFVYRSTSHRDKEAPSAIIISRHQWTGRRKEWANGSGTPRHPMPHHVASTWRVGILSGG